MHFLMSSKTINLRDAFSKVVLFTGLFSLTIILFIFAKWCFANFIAIYSQQNDASAFAVSLAPSDPQTHYGLALSSENNLLSEDLPQSLTEYKTAASLSPQDYRLWLALANAFERNNNFAEAEAAFDKTLEVAPYYSQVYWDYGNFLLRRGRTDEGFIKIRRAAETDIGYQLQAIPVARKYFSDNLAKIKKYLEGSPALDSEIALFLIEKKRFDEAFEIWDSFSSDDKKNRFKNLGNSLFTEFIATKRFNDALEIQNQIADVSEEVFTVEQIYNSSFENDIKSGEAVGFDWQLGNNIQPRVGFDESHKTDGNRSLVFLYNSLDGRDFPTLSQLIVIKPGKSYELTFSYKSELKTLALFRWQVLDHSNKVLAESEHFFKNTDWKKISLDFKTTADAEVVKIRLASQVKCLPGRCPIYGKIWFDNFELIKQAAN